MSLADDHLRDLNQLLLEQGEDVVLRRVPSADVTVRAWMPKGDQTKLVGNLDQGQALVIISPTQIISEGWMSLVLTGTQRDTRVPVKGNKIVAHGIVYNVEDADPTYINGQLVRIMMKVRG